MTDHDELSTIEGGNANTDEKSTLHNSFCTWNTRWLLRDDDQPHFALKLMRVFDHNFDIHLISISWKQYCGIGPLAVLGSLSSLAYRCALIAIEWILEKCSSLKDIRFDCNSMRWILQESSSLKNICRMLIQYDLIVVHCSSLKDILFVLRFKTLAFFRNLRHSKYLFALQFVYNWILRICHNLTIFSLHYNSK